MSVSKYNFYENTYIIVLQKVMTVCSLIIMVLIRGNQ